MTRYGKPEIFNTDQGSQFTSPRFVDVLLDAGVQVSMDGKGRWMDNVFIERLWRSLKYECVYIHAFETGTELRAGLRNWIGYYSYWVRKPRSSDSSDVIVLSFCCKKDIRAQNPRMRRCKIFGFGTPRRSASNPSADTQPEPASLVDGPGQRA